MNSHKSAKTVDINKQIRYLESLDARASQDAAASSSTPTPTAVATSMGSSVLADGGMDVAAVLASAEASIVEINTTMSYRQGPFRMEGEGAGTGMVLTADGLVLTNAHVGGRRQSHRQAGHGRGPAASTGQQQTGQGDAEGDRP